MSWLFSLALVEASLGGNSLDGEPCAPLNVTLTRRPFWHRDKTMDVLSCSPFGLTWKPLTAERGEAVLTWCREASRARTLARPAKGKASRGSGADCGARWRALLVKFSPDSCGWKTVRCLWEEDLDWSCLTLPRWGSLHDGELWERTTPGLPTSETESGFWPTPNVPNGGRRVPKGAIIKGGKTPTAYHNGKKCQVELEQAVKWPTPIASDWKGSLGNVTGNGRPKRNLAKAVKTWPTPHGMSPAGRSNGPSGNELGRAVNRAEKFPTPTSSMVTAADMEQARYAGNGKRPSYQDAKAMFPTPDVGAAKGRGQTSAAGRPRLGGSLNPTWVEWLMGWPLGWTDCADSVTDRFRQWCGLHGKRWPLAGIENAPAEHSAASADMLRRDVGGEVDRV